MGTPRSSPNRRQAIRLAAGTAVAATLGRGVRAAPPRPIKIGLVTPRSGPLAAFTEADGFILARIRKRLEPGLMVAGALRPVEILDRDSQSSENRAAEVAAELIHGDSVDLMLAASTAATVNPVADQCEVEGVPCITTDAPWETFYFGRGATAAKGFDWTWHFFWGVRDLIDAYTDLWGRIPTNRTVGMLCANEVEGNALIDPKSGFPPVLAAKGFVLVDPGRFDPMIDDYSAQIGIFKRAGIEIVSGVLTPPAFARFWTQAAQQGLKPRIATMAKALLFPSAAEALGDRAAGLSTEVWWSPHHPYRSPLTGETAAEFCTAYRAATGRQWTQPSGFKQALLEVAIDVLTRVKDIESRESIRDAIRATDCATMAGPVHWNGTPALNVSRTSLVGGQWLPGTEFKYELAIVDNQSDPSIPTQAALTPLG